MKDRKGQKSKSRGLRSRHGAFDLYSLHDVRRVAPIVILAGADSLEERAKQRIYGRMLKNTRRPNAVFSSHDLLQN